MIYFLGCIANPSFLQSHLLPWFNTTIKAVLLSHLCLLSHYSRNINKSVW